MTDGKKVDGNARVCARRGIEKQVIRRVDARAEDDGKEENEVTCT